MAASSFLALCKTLCTSLAASRAKSDAEREPNDSFPAVLRVNPHNVFCTADLRLFDDKSTQQGQGSDLKLPTLLSALFGAAPALIHESELWQAATERIASESYESSQIDVLFSCLDRLSRAECVSLHLPASMGPCNSELSPDDLLRILRLLVHLSESGDHVGAVDASPQQQSVAGGKNDTESPTVSDPSHDPHWELISFVITPSLGSGVDRLRRLTHGSSDTLANHLLADLYRLQVALVQHDSTERSQSDPQNVLSLRASRNARALFIGAYNSCVPTHGPLSVKVWQSLPRDVREGVQLRMWERVYRAVEIQAMRWPSSSISYSAPGTAVIQIQPLVSSLASAFCWLSHALDALICQLQWGTAGAQRDQHAGRQRDANEEQQMLAQLQAMGLPAADAAAWRRVVRRLAALPVRDVREVTGWAIDQLDLLPIRWLEQLSSPGQGRSSRWQPWQPLLVQLLRAVAQRVDTRFSVALWDHPVPLQEATQPTGASSSSWLIPLLRQSLLQCWQQLHSIDAAPHIWGVLSEATPLQQYLRMRLLDAAPMATNETVPLPLTLLHQRIYAHFSRLSAAMASTATATANGAAVLPLRLELLPFDAANARGSDLLDNLSVRLSPTPFSTRSLASSAWSLLVTQLDASFGTLPAWVPASRLIYAALESSASPPSATASSRVSLALSLLLRQRLQLQRALFHTVHCVPSFSKKALPRAASTRSAGWLRWALSRVLTALQDYLADALSDTLPPEAVASSSAPDGSSSASSPEPGSAKLPVDEHIRLGALWLRQLLDASLLTAPYAPLWAAFEREFYLAERLAQLDPHDESFESQLNQLMSQQKRALDFLLNLLDRLIGASASTVARLLSLRLRLSLAQEHDAFRNV